MDENEGGGGAGREVKRAGESYSPGRGSAAKVVGKTIRRCKWIRSTARFLTRRDVTDKLRATICARHTLYDIHNWRLEIADVLGCRRVRGGVVCLLARGASQTPKEWSGAGSRGCQKA